jgi:hypothetical protein
MAAEFERLVYETAQTGLDKQERVVEELRARTGGLLAASSIAASFLGEPAFRNPPLVVAALALAAFVATIAACVYVLTPKRQLVFAQSGGALYQELYDVREDLGQVYRRLAYSLDDFWTDNDATIHALFTAYRWRAAAMVVEILGLVVLVAGTLF